MKLYIFLLFCSISLVQATNSYAQKATVNLKIQNQTVQTVLDEIENQSEFSFFFNTRHVDLQRKVSIIAKKSNIFKVLEDIFTGTNVHYSVVDKKIILSTEKSVPQQTKNTITGVVKDDRGEPIIGANVVEKGTTNGTVTDMDGKYEIEIWKGAVLTFSYIGYVTKEIIVEGKEKIVNVELQEDSKALDEVVVIGYGTLEKKQLTSSVTSISGKDLMVGVSGSDISTSLQGLVSGLVMNNVGSANAGTTFQLRGLTSINAGTSPLVVIDGFPGGDMRALSQEDILSIDVLKDASAGAIYGTRAASGVILITTKSGSDTSGKVKMTYSGEMIKKQNYGAPEMLNGREYVEHDISTDYGNDTDWWRELINRDNFSHKHHFALEAGMDKAQVYTSFFYEKNEGIAIQDSRADYGGRLNAHFKLFDGWLEIRPNIDYRQASRNNHYPNFQQALRNNPTRSPYDEKSGTGYNVWTQDNMDYNVVADVNLSTNEGLEKWFKPEITFKLNIKPVPGLSFQQILGYQNIQSEGHSTTSRYHREQLENSIRGGAGLSFGKTEHLTSEGMVTYIKEFNGGHTLNAVAGYSYFEANGESFSMHNTNFDVDGVKLWNIGSGSSLKDGRANMGSSKNITERLFSVFARANYAYRNTYLLQASLRHEGSSKFAEDNRWANFWSVSAGWRISNESFMKELKWIDDLKIRFGYGVTGNNNFSSSYTANVFSPDAYWIMPNGEWMYTYGKQQSVNPKLGWEEKKEWDLGIDFSFWDGRLYGKFDYYRRKIDGMIYNVKMPQPPSAYEYQLKNIGSMESKGWEFEIGGDIIRTKDFVWTSNLNISHNTGKILTLWGNNTYYDSNLFPAPGAPGTAARIEESSSIGSFFLYKFAGFDDKGGFLIYNKDGEVIPADKKTENDKQYVGNYVPKLMLGWRHTLTYKNFDLGINLRSWIDYDVLNSLNMYFGIQGQGRTNVLKETYGKFNHIKGEKQLCDYYLEDGTFLKIDAITLGYTLPIRKYTKFVNRIRLYGTVGNVCTITGYSGINPEVNITGWAGGTEKFWSRGDFYPMARSYTFGLQLNF